jgi:hypothetical protein
VFVFEVVCEIDVTTECEIRDLEQKFLTEMTNLYNVGKHATGGDNLSNHPNATEIRAHISSTTRINRRTMSPDERSAKFGRSGATNGMYGRTHTDVVRTLSSERLKRTRFTGAIPIRLGKSNTEYFGAEKAAQISDKLSQLGKQRIGDKNSFYGKHHTDATKEVLATARKDRHRALRVEDKLSHPQMRPLTVDDVLYLGVAEAARSLGCTAPNIVYKLKSPKHTNYQYVTVSTAIKLLQASGIVIDVALISSTLLEDTG